MVIQQLVVAVVLILSLATDAHAQPPKTARVGVLASSTEGNFGPSVQVFREALGAAGWVEGRNLTLHVRYPGEQYGRLPELASELVGLEVNVLATLGTPATELVVNLETAATLGLTIPQSLLRRADDVIR